VRLLAPYFAFGQQFPEHAEQLAAGCQFAFALEDELLRRDLGASFDLGQVRAVVADPVSERLLRETGRTPSTSQVDTKPAGAVLHWIDLGALLSHAVTPAADVGGCG
jgi:hypothetical protein